VNKNNSRSPKGIFTGLNELKGFAITDAAIVFPPDSDGTNLKGNVTLPNPSIVTFELVCLSIPMAL
jgi:hypothetical protein